MRWYKTDKKLPKKTDYYLISDGNTFSIGIFVVGNTKFFDKNFHQPIISENIKYWQKISELPIDKSFKKGKI